MFKIFTQCTGVKNAPIRQLGEPVDEAKAQEVLDFFHNHNMDDVLKVWKEPVNPLPQMDQFEAAN